MTPEPPSILQQTDFRCGFFDFRNAKMPGVDYFNCGLVERPDGLWLVTRRSHNTKRDSFGMNSVWAFSIPDPTTMLPDKGYPVKFLKSFSDQHFEDPRAVYHNGKTYISCCSFRILAPKKWTKAHQIISVVDDKWQTMEQYSPIYGFNSPSVMTNRGMEKNWLWFFHEDQPHLIYKTIPHEVADFTSKFQTGDWAITWTSPNNASWSYGEPRGGTPPVRVGDEYWSFFHSSMPWERSNNGKRRYFMGAYAFEARPPFEITRMSAKPILVGSQRDPWGADKPLVVFPCGAVLRDGNWMVTGGCNDLVSFFLEIPHEALVKMTPRIKQEVMV